MSGAVRSVKKAVKGATKAVKKVASSDIGQIALAVAAPYALGAAFPAFKTLGGTGFLGGALRGGITSGIVGLASGRGIDPRNLLISSALSGGLASLREAQALRQANAMSDPAFAAAEGETIDLLDSPVTKSPVTQAPATDTFAGQTIGPVSTTEQSVMGLDYGGPEYTKSTLPKTGTDTMGLFDSSVQAKEVLPKTGIQTISDVDLDVATPYKGMTAEQIIADRTVPQAGQDAIFKEYFSAAPITEKVNLAARDFLGFEEAAAFRENPSLKTAFNFAKNNPSLVITSASMLSALSAPKQPEETEFDYEERTALVNQLGGEYLENIGSDLNKDDFKSVDDWAAFFTQRVGRAEGGIMNIPTGEPRRNAGGIMELDYRDEGGFVPIGIKEKADDVPAMLSKNEFVFTADAVKNAGNGDVDKGAQRLYNQMKMLENGGALA